ncbi:MAG: hypothetical protein M1824_002964 [Vezdaea acicularis]|nr:MAG: hypothetical protein M1824_002964 [Vezdaea acicularis]
MAENIPPTGTAANPNADASRGMPYYNRLRSELRETINKKRILDKNLSNLEDNLYKLESSYLEETSAGNIIKGFDNYIKGSSSATGSAAGGAGRKRTGVTEADRVFSRSSASYFNDSPVPTAPSSAHTTPSHAPTPTATSFNNRESSSQPTVVSTATVGNKGVKRNKKKGEDVDDEEGKSSKRNKVNFGAGRD